MKITITFDSLEEFNDYIAKAPASATLDVVPDGRVEDPQEPPQKTAMDKSKPNTRKAEKAIQAAAEASPTPVTEDFRIEVRKQLAALNKKLGFNRAAEIIKEVTGKKKLTEVALADLLKIMERAKEEIHAD